MLYTEMHVKVFNFAADMLLYTGQKGELTVALDTQAVTFHDGTTAGGLNGLISPATTVAATGSVQTDAAALKSGVNLVTGADGTKGVILPAGIAGRVVFVKNADAAAAILKVYPPGAGIINALSASAAISMAIKTSAVFMCVDGTSWVTIPLLPS